MRRDLYLLLTLLLGFGLITGCDNSTDPEPEEPEPKPSPISIDTHDSVPADDRLETITWNIEWFGSYGGGPGDLRVQLKNASIILDSLEADLYGLQEIANEDYLDSLIVYMPDYQGMVADHISQSQKTAFLYNTNTISNVSFEAIDETDGLDSHHFAGRFPFVMNFDYSHSGGTTSIMAIVIHAKCCTATDDYERRKNAAESLYQYLQDNHPDTPIIFMGDYNDDIDESIARNDNGYRESPYQIFKENSEAFTIVTQDLGQGGTSSTVSYDDVIDHITYSNELMPYYQSGSAVVMHEVESYLDSQYGSSTSDHYPVKAVISFE